MIYLDITVLSVALATMQKYFNTTSDKVLWVANIYMLTRAILVFVSGKLSDDFGHVKTFTFGVLIFAIASLGCAISSHVDLLIFCRCLQGIGATFIFVPGMSLITSRLPEEKRGRGIAFVLSIGLASMAMGPIISGLAINYLSWHWIFLLNFIVSIVAFLFIIPALKQAEQSVNKKFDWPGFILSAVFTVCITLAFENSNDWRWTSFNFSILILLSVISFFTFLIVELKSQKPLVELKFFTLPNFLTGGLIAAFVQVAVLLTIFLGIFLQNALDYTPLTAGFLLLPMVAIGVIFSNIGGFLADKFDARIPVVIGTASLVIGFLITLIFFKNISYLSLLPLLIFSGIGMFMVSGPIRTAMLFQIPQDKYGMANAILTGMRSIISVIGFAITSAIIINVEFYKAKSKLAILLPSLTTNQLHALLGLLSHTPKSIQIFNQFSPPLQQTIKSILLASYINGFFWGLIFVGSLMLISFFMAMSLTNQSTISNSQRIYTQILQIIKSGHTAKTINIEKNQI